MARRLQPCGTVAAYRRHLRHGEVPCRSCCDALALAQRERRGAPVRGRYGVNGCGTNTGYHAHRRRGEAACRPCLDAMNAYQRGRGMRNAAKAAA